MAQKKEDKKSGVKIQDLAPSKDAKGGAARAGLSGGPSVNSGGSANSMGAQANSRGENGMNTNSTKGLD